ncbi:MAG TPA: enolase C-terminal domain-like protein [Candidatus Binatia bacterium]|nr:enolase C-terminal domain-like protein [Candidatus Binatia bacterium]
MKIERLTFTPHRLKRRGRWQTASYTADFVDVFYVKIQTDDGVTGIGAGSVVPNRRGDPFIEGVEAVKAAAGDLFVGKDPLQISRLMDALHSAVPGYKRHKAGIELALYDLMGKAFNVSLSTLLGGGTCELIPVIRMLSMGSPAEMAEGALKFVQQGYLHLKVKLGTDPITDFERFKTVRSVVGPQVTLTVDFNGAYDAATAIKVITDLLAQGLAIVEQPVPGTDLLGMATVTQAVETVVLADQGVESAADVFQVARANAANAVSIKLLKFGGLQESLAATRVCEAAGLICHVGGMATSSLIDAAQAHFISATPSAVTPCEVGEFEALQGDWVEGLQVVDGCLRVPTAPGLGVSLTV